MLTVAYLACGTPSWLQTFKNVAILIENTKPALLTFQTLKKFSASGKPASRHLVHQMQYIIHR